MVVVQEGGVLHPSESILAVVPGGASFLDAGGKIGSGIGKEGIGGEVEDSGDVEGTHAVVDVETHGELVVSCYGGCTHFSVFRRRNDLWEMRCRQRYSCHMSVDSPQCLLVPHGSAQARNVILLRHWRFEMRCCGRCVHMVLASRTSVSFAHTQILGLIFRSLFGARLWGSPW